MRTFGIILMCVGAAWAAFALNMPTSIVVEGALYFPPTEVANLDLIATRQTHLNLASLAVVVGALMLGFGVVVASMRARKAAP